jgi:hypothetical protein
MILRANRGESGGHLGAGSAGSGTAGPFHDGPCFAFELEIDLRSDISRPPLDRGHQSQRQIDAIIRFWPGSSHSGQRRHSLDVGPAQRFLSMIPRHHDENPALTIYLPAASGVGEILVSEARAEAAALWEWAGCWEDGSYRDTT